MQDVWQRADSYDAYIGRWSRQVAPKFVSELRVVPGGVWIDVGCGSGALTAAILATAGPARVLALDRSVDFVARSSRSYRAATFVAGDAAALPFAGGMADAAVSGLVLNFVSRPEVAIGEMLRCVRPGGVVATYLWDYAEGMQAIRLFWDSAIAVDARAAALDEATRFPLCQPAALEQLFANGGVNEIRLGSVTIPTVFRDFDDLWSPFLGGQGPAPTYTMNLPEDQRVALRERFRSVVPVSADGSIALTARAWVARGVRSSSVAS